MYTASVSVALTQSCSTLACRPLRRTSDCASAVARDLSPKFASSAPSCGCRVRRKPPIDEPWQPTFEQVSASTSC